MISLGKYIVRQAFVLAVVLFAASCGKGDGGEDSVAASADWRQSSTVGYGEASAAIQLSGKVGVQWHAEIKEGSSWCSFRLNDLTNSVKQGTIQPGVLGNILDVYFTRNGSTDQRRAIIEVVFDGMAPITLDLIQLSQTQNNLPHFGVWAELPQNKENPNYEYVTHYAPLGSKFVRNFSLCFDKSKKAALWVAYPIHDAYFGSSGRTDLWAFDPIIPVAQQANCVSRSYRGNYDRGHQLPSADRQITYEMNAQTFYMSNLTPQLDRLNQDMWANLEGKIRTYNCSDTLYVVTGAYFGANAGTTADGAGSVVPIPTNYFKVLLRSRSGATGKAVSALSADELISIGFWVEQRSYGDIQPPKSICTSVADIEAKTGFVFFPNLTGGTATSVKNQNNPSQWGIN